MNLLKNFSHEIKFLLCLFHIIYDIMKKMKSILLNKLYKTKESFRIIVKLIRSFSLLLLEYVYITNINYIFSIFEELINKLNEEIKVKYFKFKYYLL